MTLVGIESGKPQVAMIIVELQRTDTGCVRLKSQYQDVGHEAHVPSENLGVTALIKRAREALISFPRSRGKDVVTMAGFIYFSREGQFEGWNAGSGHFRPCKKDIELVKELDTSTKWSEGKFAAGYCPEGGDREMQDDCEKIEDCDSAAVDSWLAVRRI